MAEPAIAVCGSAVLDQPGLAAHAHALGAEIARRGYTLVCGGMTGVMEEACRGAQEARAHGAKGLIVGILPVADKAAANPYCDIVLPTGIGYARNLLVVMAGDAVILCGGGSGTLSEAALAWQLGKPVVALAPSGGWAAELAGRTLDHRRSDVIVTATSAAHAVDEAARRFRA